MHLSFAFQKMRLYANNIDNESQLVNKTKLWFSKPIVKNK